MDRSIIITGFMGAGKTTLARTLGELLKCPVTDLDQLIANMHSRTAKEIITQDGEAAFREIETATLRRALNFDPPHVIALGGGAWTLQQNRDLIESKGGFTVWLDAPFSLCWQRILENGSERPLAPTKEVAQRLYESRRHAYGKASLHLNADLTVDVGVLAGRILTALKPCDSIRWAEKS